MAKTRHQLRSKLQETRIAKEVGGKVQVGSGSSWRAKSDVRKMGELRIEAKHTNKKTYTLKLSDILKIRNEAVLGGMEPWAIQVEFVRGIGYSTKFAVIDYFHFWELLHSNASIPHHQKILYRDWGAAWRELEAKQYVLHCDAMLAETGAALAEGQIWGMRIIFKKGAYDMHAQVAIIDWNLFNSLRESQ